MGNNDKICLWMKISRKIILYVPIRSYNKFYISFSGLIIISSMFPILIRFQTYPMVIAFIQTRDNSLLQTKEFNDIDNVFAIDKFFANWNIGSG